MEKTSTLKEASIQVGQKLVDMYLSRVFRIVEGDTELIPVVPGFLIRPERLILYFGRTHLGIEYVGPEVISELPKGGCKLELQWFDFTGEAEGLLNRIIGFRYNEKMPSMELPVVSCDLVLPTNRGADELMRLNWNWDAQDMILGFNTGGIHAQPGQFTRIVNGLFFDADESGLRSRHIKWLDLVPLAYDESDDIYDSFRIDFSTLSALANVDARHPYPVPEDFKWQKLPRINRFVELLANRSMKELDITRFLASSDNTFILKMRFSAKEIYPECICEWQSEAKGPIKPDFFVVGTNGYADIVEFKLPELGGNVVVGAGNRERFSAEIQSYISQTRVYREFFDDPRNRRWVEETYGFKVYKPRRYLVLGRRWHFDSDEWRCIEADYKGLNILTYDDIIDGVVVQFYH